MIWFKNYAVEELDAYLHKKAGLVSLLGIHVFEINGDVLKLNMNVDERLHQVHGIMHGGATCVLIETAGSLASGLILDPNLSYAVGSQINVNHLRPIKQGMLTAVVKAVHLGRQKHVWDISVYEESTGKIVSKGELTCSVLKVHEYDR
jgi:1,4-dihydroxy-2-naphthoyl-CoA hydrolase